ncbi:kelch-like protein 41b [Uloborus diversus]|uniref:kelch-like protein 41b n=1 Tax=Uloborus diversus TaxID=327109 RepID=UPI00240961E2|nr:kelch-like protein 41b [Uloborus diversus]
MAMGVAANESFLWIAGGITNENDSISILDTVWCYDKRFGRWSKTSNLPYAVAFPSLLISQKQIVCLGGASKPPNVEKNELESTADVFCYENGRWQELIQMPKPCHSVIGCISGGNIFLLGGFSTQTMSQICEPYQYRSKDNRWGRLSPFPEEAAGFIVAATT